MRYTSLLSCCLMLFLTACSEDAADGSSTGQGGSMTRFALHNNFMYVVDAKNLQVFSSYENGFQQITNIPIDFGLETIFARDEFLYLGASDAMYIYSISDPAQPTFVFRYSHVTSCDPVVVQGDRAYVTMRGGSLCNAGSNALEIIDISDPYAPVLIANYPMQSPYGLAVKNEYLFLCEGNNGFKVFDISDEKNIHLLRHIENINSYDVIATENLLTITGEDGIFQFEYPDPVDVILQLSAIPVYRETN